MGGAKSTGSRLRRPRRGERWRGEGKLDGKGARPRRGEQGRAGRKHAATCPLPRRALGCSRPRRGAWSDLGWSSWDAVARRSLLAVEGPRTRLGGFWRPRPGGWRRKRHATEPCGAARRPPSARLARGGAHGVGSPALRPPTSLMSDSSRPPITIYTDGGADPNPGPGGWGAVLLVAR